MSHNTTQFKQTGNKTILLISSHVVRGCVGSRASLFTLERMGFCVWSLLTVSLTWHPGQGKAHRMITRDDDFAQFCDDIANSPHADEIDAVMSGYFASAAQVASTARLIDRLKAARTERIYLCDPVMADESGLYITPDTALAIRDSLLPRADILKPNRSELEWIYARPLNTNAAIIAALADIPARTKLVTSAWTQDAKNIGNLLIHDEHCWLAEHPLVANPVNGLGDLSAALFFSYILNGMEKIQALEKTTAAVFDCLQHTIMAGANELLLARSDIYFIQPVTQVTLTKI